MVNCAQETDPWSGCVLSWLTGEQGQERCRWWSIGVGLVMHLGLFGVEVRSHTIVQAVGTRLSYSGGNLLLAVVNIMIHSSRPPSGFASLSVQQTTQSRITGRQVRQQPKPRERTMRLPGCKASARSW